MLISPCTERCREKSFFRALTAVNLRTGDPINAPHPALQGATCSNGISGRYAKSVVGYPSIRWSSRGPTRETFGTFHDCMEQVQLAFAISSGVSVWDADSAV